MKHKKVIASILAAVLLCTIMIASGLADSSWREEQLKKFEEMQHSSIHANISNGGFYYLKSSKFYVRKVTGVDMDGNFILGSWERVYNRSDVGFDEVDDVTLPGTAVCFAYSFDVRLGTDFPYSGVFWNKPDIRVSDIDIETGGAVRTASITIKVDNVTVVNETNCASHSDWTP